MTLEEASKADAVVIGSGMLICDIVANSKLMATLKLDPSR